MGRLGFLSLLDGENPTDSMIYNRQKSIRLKVVEVRGPSCYIIPWQKGKETTRENQRSNRSPKLFNRLHWIICEGGQSATALPLPKVHIMGLERQLSS